MKRIAKFEKVSFSQFKPAFEETFPHENAEEAYNALKLPRRATKGSAGYDFYSPASFTLAPGETIKIPTGIRARSFVCS